MVVPRFLARLLPADLYGWWVGKGMDRAYARDLRRPTVRREPVEASKLRAVVFSDHHRGNGDAADDFRRCEEAYAAALGWYLEQGHELWLLGDVEELWENRTAEVMERYAGILGLEREFGPKLHRIYGNHDLTWRNRATARHHLPNIPVHEAMRVTVTDGGRRLGELFLTHGHQGTIDSGNLLILPFSRFVVRFIWGSLQRWRGYPNTGPAEDALLRHRHDEAMARWADAHPQALVLIAGHTHHPVFLSSDPLDFDEDARSCEAEYLAAQRAGAPPAELAKLRARRELTRVRALREQPYEPPRLEGWSYFNSGCCSFADGDITGLEFTDGELRLVRWPGDKQNPAPEILAREPILDVFATLHGGAARPARASAGSLRRRAGRALRRRLHVAT